MVNYKHRWIHSGLRPDLLFLTSRKEQNMNDYEQKKEVGDIGEQKFEELLIRHGRDIIFRAPSDVNLPSFDFIVMNKFGPKRPSILIEIKTETFNTGRIAIECEYDGNLSGINTTKSDWYVVYNTKKEKFFCMSTEEVRRHTKNMTPHPCVGGKTKCYFLPESLFLEVA